MTSPRRDERGAALALAIVFMLVIGGVSAALMSMISSGLHGRVVLDKARDREYAADGAIQTAIAQIRAVHPTAGYQGPGLTACPPIPDHTLNQVKIHIDCTPAPGRTLSGYLQQNIVFTACGFDEVTGGKCPSSKVITRAQINFQTVGSGTSLQIQRTWVQSWSVNR
jgi:hypothetical protein